MVANLQHGRVIELERRLEASEAAQLVVEEATRWAKVRDAIERLAAINKARLQQWKSTRPVRLSR